MTGPSTLVEALALLGEQSKLTTKALRKRKPSLARRSIWGVCARASPA